MRTYLFPLIALLLLALVGPALADNGRIEINEASVAAAGGFPFTISQPGSYVLTSNLLVPPSSDGIVLMASDVTVDLNGFRIAGPAGCEPMQDCGQSAIRSGTGQGHGVTVRNGIIRGFNDTCVELRDFAYVTDLVVRECGDHGISVGREGLVVNNRVSEFVQVGIEMTDPTSAYAHNVVSSGIQGASAIVGGRATAGNLCGDGSCSARGARRFYLTQDFHDGSQAPGACDAGFHMASIWEILD